jgi:phosphoglycolate phosphatase
MAAFDSGPGRGWQLIVFDFDGTLADSFGWFSAALNDIAPRWRFRPIAADAEPMLRQLHAGAILRHLGVPGWKVPLIAADLRRRMGRDIDRIRLFDGVAPMLEGLAEGGLRLAIASSNAATNVERVLGPRLCDLVAARECGAAISGKAARLRRLLRRARLAPGQAIYIGDEIRDIDAARAVGMAAGVVGWGYNDLGALRRQRPDIVFRRVADIGERLAGAAAGGPARPAADPGG